MFCKEIFLEQGFVLMQLLETQRCGLQEIVQNKMNR